MARTVPLPIPQSGIHPADVPPRRGLIIVLSVLAGALIAALWSFRFVDSVIGDNVANTLLGHDAKHTEIAGLVAGTVFAFVSGLAGTFTACNIAVFGAIAPLAQAQRPAQADADASDRVATRADGGVSPRAALRPLSRLVLGMVVVSAAYGAIGALAGERLPQLSTAQPASGLPPRLIQASVVFGLIGLAFGYLGLAALRVVPDPFARLSQRFPHARLVVVGALIGGFLTGRPFPLFHKLFEYAAETHNPFYGAAVFVLQSLGNITLMALLFAVLVYATRGRFTRWLTARPARVATITAVAFLVVGAFTFLYWDVRLPAMFGYGWFPTASW
ncbi:sulfite exporter TauE/SafE family protein [Microbispora sp. NBC_01189]|uniref:urease accessory protein UreH domain-containing protein n=1 Tax=Microbispora sp. NBC_01189 TaxID=2903583 RepID=UPI002E0F300D|nr:sulfite exporter TauE/SafE family protein [Microbispora sp. NBC_01189]